MTNSAIINELLSIEAAATMLAERAERLRRKLEPVSTGSNSKKEDMLTAAALARVNAKWNKTKLKQMQSKKTP